MTEFQKVLFSDASKVTATARRTLADGTVETARLVGGVSDGSAESFQASAEKSGVKMNVRMADGTERTRTYAATKTGSLAGRAVLDILGLAPATDPVPDSTKRRGRSVIAPSDNHTSNGTAPAQS